MNNDMEKKMSGLRKWATPLTVGTFLIMGVTGVLMFFHLESTLNKVIHEWAGWAMLVGVGAHLVLNWRAFTTYLKRPLAKGIMGISALLLVVSFIPTGQEGNPMKMAAEKMQEAPIEAVIAVSGMDLAEGMQVLAEAGVDVSEGQSLSEASGGKRGVQMAALRALFAE